MIDGSVSIFIQNLDYKKMAYDATGRRPRIMSDVQAAIEFRDVSFFLGDGRRLLAHLSLTVAPGETLVFLGRSGSGKTTTMKLINRLLDPTSGEVRVQGTATTDWDPIRLRRRIGYVIQEIGLFPHLTVEENVGVVPRLEGWPAQKIERRARELLAMVSLEPALFARRYPGELSGGQRQRVGVARALAADPPIILLDEPFGALDPITRLEIQEEFRSLQKTLNKTSVFVTHDVSEALALASRIGLLKDGELIVLGPPGDLLNSEDPEARAFARCYHETTARSLS
jgi:osmoprotectant transport system ATP-binding protein